MPVAPSRPHTDAVVATIDAAALAQASQVMVGRGEQPDGSGWQGEPGASEFRPYVVLYPNSGRPDGNVSEPTEYLDYQCQCTCVAATQEGAEAVADLVKTALVNVSLTVVGRSCYPGLLLVDRPVTRDDTVAPPVHYAVIQVGWRTQPA